jgi:hypothetical protein
MMHGKRENFVMQHNVQSCLVMAPAINIYAALASKVFTQHGYLTGLTMAQILENVDHFFFC